jgi:thioredoxin-like negative regulator of GroEL
MTGATAPVDEGWPLLAGYLFSDAHKAFAHAPAGANRDLGEAASLLNHPPVTAGKIARAEGLLRPLAAGTDDTAMYARYLLARIAHLHRAASVAEIETAYREVISANPEHPLAQIAAGKLALVLLYQRPELTIAGRLDAAAALAPAAGRGTLTEAACAYYRALAGAALFYDVLDERVYDWLQRADAIGTDDVLAAASLRIQLAEVARALGRRGEALAHYRRFLAEILPTDNRYRTARERMEELEAAP